MATQVRFPLGTYISVDRTMFERCRTVLYCTVQYGTVTVPKCDVKYGKILDSEPRYSTPKYQGTYFHRTVRSKKYRTESMMWSLVLLATVEIPGKYNPLEAPSRPELIVLPDLRTICDYATAPCKHECAVLKKTRHARPAHEVWRDGIVMQRALMLFSVWRYWPYFSSHFSPMSISSWGISFPILSIRCCFDLSLLILLHKLTSLINNILEILMHR